MEVGLSALSRGTEWGKNKFWLDTARFGWATLIVAVSWEKNVIVSQVKVGIDPSHAFQSNFMILWRFTTKLETQWRARREKIILYKVRLRESCDPRILDMRVYSENRKFPTMNSGFPRRHCRV